MCKRAETDLDFARQLQGGVNAIMHDFTQYYHDADGVESRENGIAVGQGKFLSSTSISASVPVAAQAVVVGGTD